MIVWSIKIRGYGLRYQPRKAIKAQSLADFITEYSFNTETEDKDPKEKIAVIPNVASGPSAGQSYEWDLYVDGSSSSEGSGASIILKCPQGFST